MLRRWLPVLLAASVLYGLALRTVSADLIDVVSVHSTEDESEFVLLDVPFFKLLDVREKPAGHSEVTFVEAPFITLYKDERGPEHNRVKATSVVGFSLLRYEREGDEQVRSEFLTLPLVGSLFKYERDADGSSAKYLFFFGHSRRSSK